MITLKSELKELRKVKRNRYDNYSLVCEPLSHNPFMTKILKSQNFTPAAGVKHIDNVEMKNSPSVDGGEFRSPREGIMSRKEFELRTSLTVLKQFGPEKKRKGRNDAISQSMEIKP